MAECSCDAGCRVYIINLESVQIVGKQFCMTCHVYELPTEHLEHVWDSDRTCGHTMTHWVVDSAHLTFLNTMLIYDSIVYITGFCRFKTF